MPDTKRPSRMTGSQRREQLLSVGRELFAEKGFEGTSVEDLSLVSRSEIFESQGVELG